MKKLLSAVAACALLTAPALAEDVKIGSVAGITGPIAGLVEPIMAGRNLAAEEINAAGGVLDGRKLVMIAADGQCDPKAGVDAGNKVVNVDQVVAVVGASCSGETNGMVQSVTIPAGVASISDSATAPSITDLEDNGLVFRTAPSDSFQGKALAEYAFDQGYKKLAVTYANDDYNAGIAKVFEEAFKGLGGEITAIQLHEPNKASYRAELTTLSEGDPEALAVFAYVDGSGITIIKNALETGAFTKFFGADGMYDAKVIDAIGADSLKDSIWLTATATNPDLPGYEHFAEGIKAAGYDPQAPYVSQGYDATMLVALAIEKAGSTDRRAIADALMQLNDPEGEKVYAGEWEKAKQLIQDGKAINYEGVSGPIDFDENGDVSDATYGINFVGDDGAWQKTFLD